MQVHPVGTAGGIEEFFNSEFSLFSVEPRGSLGVTMCALFYAMIIFYGYQRMAMVKPPGWPATGLILLAYVIIQPHMAAKAGTGRDDTSRVTRESTGSYPNPFS